MQYVSISTLHKIDVLDRDRAAVAEVDDDDGEADGGLAGRHGQHEQGKDLTDEVAHEGGEGDQVDVDGEQHELDRHQDDDDVLAVEEDAEDAQREEDRRDGQVVAETDGHGLRSAAGTMASPGRTLTTSTAVALPRATWAAIDWRLTPSLWRSVRTMAPIMATSRIRPAPWK